MFYEGGFHCDIPMIFDRNQISPFFYLIFSMPRYSTFRVVSLDHPLHIVRQQSTEKIVILVILENLGALEQT